MKKLIVLCMLLAFASCEKGSVAPEPPITVLSVTDKIIYPSNKIEVNWKNYNMPPGTLVMAEIRNTATDRTIWSLRADVEANFKDGFATKNDGHAMFTLPPLEGNEGFYEKGGKHFELKLKIYEFVDLTYIFRPAMSALIRDITILPNGCEFPTGYSTTTHKPCNGPIE